MTIGQIKQLGLGDEVFWTDPDQGLCSRTYKIERIFVVDYKDGNPIVRIFDIDGSYIECFADELS